MLLLLRTPPGSLKDLLHGILRACVLPMWQRAASPPCGPATGAAAAAADKDQLQHWALRRAVTICSSPALLPWAAIILVRFLGSKVLCVLAVIYKGYGIFAPSARGLLLPTMPANCHRYALVFVTTSPTRLRSLSSVDYCLCSSWITFAAAAAPVCDDDALSLLSSCMYRLPLTVFCQSLTILPCYESRTASGRVCGCRIACLASPKTRAPCLPPATDWPCTQSLPAQSLAGVAHTPPHGAAARKGSTQQTRELAAGYGSLGTATCKHAGVHLCAVLETPPMRPETHHVQLKVGEERERDTNGQATGVSLQHPVLEHTTTTTKSCQLLVCLQRETIERSARRTRTQRKSAEHQHKLDSRCTSRPLCCCHKHGQSVVASILGSRPAEGFIKAVAA